MSYPQYPNGAAASPENPYPPAHWYLGEEHAMARPRRPGTVTAGCIMSWVGGSLGILGGAVLAAASGQRDFQDRLGIDADGASVLGMIGLVTVAWCALVIVFGVLAFIGRRWAALTLLVMAGLYALVSLIGMASSGQSSGVFGMGYALAASVLILGGSKHWFAYRAGR